MIEPQELRLGNILLLDDSKFVRVLWFRLENACIMEIGVKYPSAIVGLDRLKPIELTEEWLLKFGFEAERSTVYLKLKYSTNVSDYVLYDRETKELLFVKDNQLWLSKYEYVHQLQNLFHSLCGEELTIK